jgi:hypothetical protein
VTAAEVEGEGRKEAVLDYVIERDTGAAGAEECEDEEDADADLQVTDKFLAIQSGLAAADIGSRANREREIVQKRESSAVVDEEVQEVFRRDRDELHRQHNDV